jgi:hypothetical protein
MKSDEVGTTLKHPESFHGNVKNLSKRMEMKDKGECHFYFKNLTLPLGSIYNVVYLVSGKVSARVRNVTYR